MVKVSVITPVYNTEKYLDKCLSSLVKQTLDDIEFIWVDNGANKECKDILAKYSESRPNIKIITLPENVGYGGAMNTGLLNATGEFVGFCDSDDYMDADYYEKLYNLAKKNDCEIVYTATKWEYEDRTFISKHFDNRKIVKNLEDKINILKYGSIWDKIFKRDLLIKNDISFPKHSKSYFEDNIVAFPSFYFAKKICLTDNTFYHYVQHASSMMHRDDINSERAEYQVNVVAFIINFAIEHKFTDVQKKATLFYVNRGLGLKGIVKDKNRYDTLLSLLNDDDYIKSQLKKYYRCYNPTAFSKLFSVNRSIFVVALYIFGIRIKLKKYKFS